MSQIQNGQPTRRDHLIALAWCIGIVLLAALLFALGGGFPPHAWRSLAPALLRTKNAGATPSLLTVAVQSLAFLGAWAIWCFLTLSTLQRIWEHLPLSLRERFALMRQKPPIQVPTWARTQPDSQQHIQPLTPDLSVETDGASTQAQQEQSSPLYQQNYLLFRDDLVEAPSVSTPEPVRVKPPQPLILPTLQTRPTKVQDHDQRDATQAQTVVLADTDHTQTRLTASQSSAEARSMPEHAVAVASQDTRDAPTTKGAVNDETQQQEVADDSKASKHVIPPRERLETYLAQVLAQGTPLEKITIDMLRDGTHVKRETISTFLREKKQAVSEGNTQTTASPPGAQALRTLEADGVTDVGITRAQQPNGDKLLCMCFPQQKRGLFVVADGMGGHANGHQASRLLIDTFEHAFREVLETIEEDAAKDLMIETIYQANANILQQNQSSSKREERAQMGTTVTLALVFGQNAYVANVGDSRTYWQSRQHGLVRVTTDHSTVQQMVESGVISDEERYTHPDRSHIYRTIGQEADVEVDAFFVSLMPTECLLLCSDGLWELVRDVDIAQIMERPALSTGQIARSLIDAALQGGGSDNVTALVVRAA